MEALVSQVTRREGSSQELGGSYQTLGVDHSHACLQRGLWQAIVTLDCSFLTCKKLG